MNIPFSPPYIDQDIIDEVVSSLKSGWITTGPKVKALEQEVIKLSGAPQALCVNSWTSGAMLMLKWFGIGPGDEVIIPAYTYSATALAVLHCGGTPVMIDINDDFTLDIQLIREKITAHTKVIMPVDIAGWPCDYESINRLVNEPAVKNKFISNHKNQEKLGRILVLSDAAHSIGAKVNQVETGLLTDITIFSFHAVKNITTAEGGVICINLPKPFDNAEEYAYLRMMTLNGQTKDAFTKSKAGGWRYDIIDLGLKINMPDVCAAIGLAQIRKYDHDLLTERKRVFDQYSKAFSRLAWAQVPPQDDGKRISSCHLYALRIKGITETQRDAVIDEISKTGVAVNVHFIPMPMLTLFKKLGYDIKDFPNSYDNYSREISLPIYPQLTTEQVEYIIAAVTNSYTHVIRP
ncbi:MAG: DegT/DnrJ/EryC1/StrS family aminotransferase [Ferruginibacter sp.]